VREWEPAEWVLWVLVMAMYLVSELNGRSDVRMKFWHSSLVQRLRCY
jgi:hypothetical protein